MTYPTARQIATDVMRQNTSAVAVAQSALARAQTVNARLNALTVLNPDLLADAAQVDGRIADGETLPLAGVPVVIKDNIWVKDFVITNGSRLFAEFKAPEDAICVRRLRDAGALILGIGTCSEFACKGVTNTPLHGITRHPDNPDLTPGGSSGGPAVAVAAGIAPIAIGTDAGGSSRRPPAHVGVVGFKPSQDAIPCGPGFAEPVWGISALCPITRTVSDAALAFSVLSQAPGVGMPDSPRLAYAPEMGLGAPVDDAVAQLCDRAIQTVSRIASVTTTAPDWDPQGHPSAIMALQFSGLAALYAKDWLDNPGLFDPDIGAQIEAGLALSGVEVAHALQASQAMRRDLGAFLSEFDFLMTPTTPCTAWPATQLGPSEIGDIAAGPRDHAAFTPQINHAGLPAITIPCGFTAQNLPVGLQIIGAAGSDGAVLALAERVEALFWKAGLTRAKAKAVA